jgi:hypothetical protein
LVSAMATHLPRGLACLLEPARLPVQDPPWLTAKLTAKPADSRGSRRIALDGYIRPELRRCGRRWPPEQLTSPRVEVAKRYGPARSSPIVHRLRSCHP